MQVKKDSEWQNRTSITEFILLGFGNLETWNLLLFVLFLAIYIVTLSGNLLIVTVVVTEQHLHRPMYFFLANLSFLEISCTTTILPRMLASFLIGDKTISLWACFLQMHVFGTLAATECYLLAVMSYDRYLAICRPLHYVTLMNEGTCLLMVSVSWILGIFLVNSTAYMLPQLKFCSENKIDHFFCDFTPVVRLSCSDIWVIEMASFAAASIGLLPTFVITVTSYVLIIRTILKIPSVTGRQKAFSTCSSHLTVVSVFYGSLICVYVLPTTGKFRDLMKIFSCMYTILTPMINPFIYSLRNKDVKEVLRKILHKCLDISEIRQW